MLLTVASTATSSSHIGTNWRGFVTACHARWCMGISSPGTSASNLARPGRRCWYSTGTWRAGVSRQPTWRMWTFLACPDLDAYHSVLRQDVPHLDVRDIRQLTDYGNLLRVMDTIYWETCHDGRRLRISVQAPADDPTIRSELAAALRALDWFLILMLLEGSASRRPGIESAREGQSAGKRWRLKACCADPESVRRTNGDQNRGQGRGCYRLVEPLERVPSRMCRSGLTRPVRPIERADLPICHTVG